MTRSGVLLNSLVQDFFWTNQSGGQPPANKVQRLCTARTVTQCFKKVLTHSPFVLQKIRVEPGRRPLSFLMPSVIVPVWNRCGTYMGLSSSGGRKRLSEITQVFSFLFFFFFIFNLKLVLLSEISVSPATCV